MSLGKGAVYSMSTKQKVNTRSSTEAELVGVNDAIGMALWMRMFMEGQGYKIKDNVVYQDNQSAILLEKNGKKSSGKRTRHLSLTYYFITNQIEKKVKAIARNKVQEVPRQHFKRPRSGKDPIAG